jgi:hypothetical protein
MTMYQNYQKNLILIHITFLFYFIGNKREMRINNGGPIRSQKNKLLQNYVTFCFERKQINHDIHLH